MLLSVSVRCAMRHTVGGLRILPPYPKPSGSPANKPHPAGDHNRATPIDLWSHCWSQGIVSKKKDSPYRSGRSPDWLKMKNSNAPAVKREAEEDWSKGQKLRRQGGEWTRIISSSNAHRLQAAL